MHGARFLSLRRDLKFSQIFSKLSQFFSNLLTSVLEKIPCTGTFSRGRDAISSFLKVGSNSLKPVQVDPSPSLASTHVDTKRTSRSRSREQVQTSWRVNAHLKNRTWNWKTPGQAFSNYKYEFYSQDLQVNGSKYEFCFP